MDRNAKKLTKTTRKKFSCEECDYKSSKHSVLLKHRGLVHMGFKYACKVYNFQTIHKGSLLNHQKSAHEGIKYPCKECDYKAT